MKGFGRRLIALFIIIFTLITSYCQTFAAIVYIMNTRSNGKTYDDGRHSQPIQDYYVDNQIDYSYFCLSGGRRLRDYDSYNTGDYSEKIEINDKIALNNLESTISGINSSGGDPITVTGDNIKALRWLIKNIYTEGVNIESDKYMLENLNSIIKLYAANGFKDKLLTDGTDRELIEVIEQMVIWSFTDNASDSYDYEKIIKSVNDMLSIKVIENYEESEISETDAQCMYALYTALCNGANNAKNGNSGYSLEIETNNYEIEVKQKDNTFNCTATGQTIIMGPISVNIKSDEGIAFNKDLIENYNDELNIKNNGIKYYNDKNCTSPLNITDKRDLIGKTFYIKTNATENIQTGGKNKVVEYKVTADIGYRINDLKGSIYYGKKDDGSDGYRQPILQLKKELKASQTGDIISKEIEGMDIALIQRITEVKHYNPITGEWEEKKYEDRLKNIDSSNEKTKYIMDKSPINVQLGDIVTYKITVYNEGNSDSIINEITNSVPSDMDLLKNITTTSLNDGHEIEKMVTPGETGVITPRIKNRKANWNNNSNCDVFSLQERDIGTNEINEGIELKANENFSLEIQYLVTENANTGIEKYNFAAVTNYTRKSDNERANKVAIDIDSEDNDLFSDSGKYDEQREAYIRKLNLFKKRIEGAPFNKNILSYQDDDDFEIIRIGKFDLALRTFITKIGNTELNGEKSREPKYTVRSAAAVANRQTAIYYHTKDPVTVQEGDEVIYTIRVYNEGWIDGYVNEITDYLPAGLEFKEGDTVNQGWQATKENDGTTIVRRKLGNGYFLEAGRDGQAIADGLAKIGADKDYTGKGKDYTLDVQIKCIVTSSNVEQIVNVAELTDYGYKYKEYNTVKFMNAQKLNNSESNKNKDRDSYQNNVFKNDDAVDIKNIKSYTEKIVNTQLVSGKTQYHGEEDDDDFEVIHVKKIDLELRTFITDVKDKDNKPVNSEQLENGKPHSEQRNNTGNKTVTVPNNREPYFLNIRDSAYIKRYKNGRYYGDKTPITVNKGDLITYTIRVYNQGNEDAWIKNLSVYLPKGLEYVSSGDNSNVTWTYTNKKGPTKIETAGLSYVTPGRDGQSIAEWLSSEDVNEENIENYERNNYITGEESKKDLNIVDGNEYSSFAKSIQIVCKVTGESYENLSIVAELSDYGYGNIWHDASEESKADRDSIQNNAIDESNIDQSIKQYVNNAKYEDGWWQGPEDDSDFENIHVQPLSEYSLSLLKVDIQETPLQGVGFKLNNNQVKYTDEYGYITLEDKVKINNSNYKTQDVYTITEVEEKLGYYKLKEPITLYVNKTIDEETNNYKVESASFNQNRTVNTINVLLNNNTDTAEIVVMSDANNVLIKVQNKEVKSNYFVSLKKVYYEEGNSTERNLRGARFNVQGKTNISEETNANGLISVGSFDMNLDSSTTEDKFTFQETTIIQDGNDVTNQYCRIIEPVTLTITKEYVNYQYRVKDAYLDNSNVLLEDGTPVTLRVDKTVNSVIVTVVNKKIAPSTYDVKILKVDENNNALSGAVFTIGGRSSTKDTQRTDAQGVTFAERNIPINESNYKTDDVYIITEKTAPDGYYNISSSLKLTVEKEIKDHGYKVKSAYLDKNKMQLENSENSDSVNVNAHIDSDGRTIIVTIQNKEKPKDINLKLSLDIVQANDGKQGLAEGRSKENPYDFNNLYTCQLKSTNGSDSATIIYEICVTNDSEAAATVDSINEYFLLDRSNITCQKIFANSDYRRILSFSNLDSQANIENINYSSTTYGQYNKYNLNNLKMSIAANGTGYIYMQFNINSRILNNALVKAPNEKYVILKNYAEIASGTDDINSIYGNLQPPYYARIYSADTSVMGVSQNIGKNGQKDDDGDNVLIKLRYIQSIGGSGKVFLDEPLQSKLNKNERVGNGKYDNGEAVISGVNVNLAQTGEGRVVPSIDNGNYEWVSTDYGGSIRVRKNGVEYVSNTYNDDDAGTVKNVRFNYSGGSRYTTTGADGTYQFDNSANIYHGTYIVRFYWGEGNNSQSSNGEKITVDKYKSTIRASDYPSNNWQRASGYSDALDSLTLRDNFDTNNNLYRDNFDTNNSLYNDISSGNNSNGNAKMESTTMEIYVEPKLEEFDTGRKGRKTEWRSYQVEVRHEEWVESTTTSEITDEEGNTRVIEVPYRYLDIYYTTETRWESYQVYVPIMAWREIGQSPSEILANVDLGLIERPIQRIEIEKKVDEFQVVSDQGQTVAEAKVNKDGTLNVLSGSVTGGRNYGWIKLETDQEILNSGTVAKVKYGITLNNTSEIDYTVYDNGRWVVDANYYNYGTRSGNSSVMKLRADGLEDYLSGLSADIDKNTSWKEPKSTKEIEEKTITNYIATDMYETGPVTKSFWTPGGTKTIQFKAGGTSETKLSEFSSKYSNTEVKDFNNIIKDNYETLTAYKDSIILDPPNIPNVPTLSSMKTISYDAETQLNSGKDLEFNNAAQLKDVQKLYKSGRTISLDQSNFFDYAEKIIITPPTGEEKDYTAIIITSILATIVLGAGIVLIKKKVLD